MISKREILDFAELLKLPANTVEKDYVLGWLLVGIWNHPQTIKHWVFKGGTCLKKCFFETYRFSEDLDFTVQDPSMFDEATLRKIFLDIAELVEDESGIRMPQESIKIEVFHNPRGFLSVEGRIAYVGPLQPRGSAPKVKFDLSNDEILVEEPVFSDVYHPYSDFPEQGLQAHTYSFEETFAEKIRALAQRARPRDLYDVVHLYRNRELLASKSRLERILEKKCQFKNIEVPTLSYMESHPKRNELAQEWSNMLRHQLPLLPPLEFFWSELPEVFEWLHSKKERVPLEDIEKDGRGSWVPKRVREPSLQASLLEAIQYAAANHLCIQVKLRSEKFTCEPYALSLQDKGRIFLSCVEKDSGTVRIISLEHIRAVQSLEEGFSPRFNIEISSLRAHK
jgi:predicted nucleotidyltransferase component of viral defense system